MLLLLLELHEHGRGGAEPRVLVVAVERGGVGVRLALGRPRVLVPGWKEGEGGGG